MTLQRTPIENGGSSFCLPERPQSISRSLTCHASSEEVAASIVPTLPQRPRPCGIRPVRVSTSSKETLCARQSETSLGEEHLHHEQPESDRPNDGDDLEQGETPRRETAISLNSSAKRRWQRSPSVSSSTARSDISTSASSKTGDARLVVALAGALKKKHGSLDAAFLALGQASPGRVSRAEWDAGMKNAVRGDSGLQVALPAWLHPKASAGAAEVSLDAWRLFFGYGGDSGVEDGQLAQRAGTPVTSAGPQRVRDFLRATSRNVSLRVRGLHSAISEKMERHVPNNIQKAEARQLQEELKQHKLVGVLALAYLFAAKFGSLDAAFALLDLNSTRSNNPLQFELALEELHVDVEDLTGFAPKQLFLLLHARGVTGGISKHKWDIFFGGACGDVSFCDLIAEANVVPLSRRAGPHLAWLWRENDSAHGECTVRSGTRVDTHSPLSMPADTVTIAPEVREDPLASRVPPVRRIRPAATDPSLAQSDVARRIAVHWSPELVVPSVEVLQASIAQSSGPCTPCPVAEPTDVGSTVAGDADGLDDTIPKVGEGLVSSPSPTIDDGVPCSQPLRLFIEDNPPDLVPLENMSSGKHSPSNGLLRVGARASAARSLSPVSPRADEKPESRAGRALSTTPRLEQPEIVPPSHNASGAAVSQALNDRPRGRSTAPRKARSPAPAPVRSRSGMTGPAAGKPASRRMSMRSVSTAVAVATSASRERRGSLERSTAKRALAQPADRGNVKSTLAQPSEDDDFFRSRLKGEMSALQADESRRYLGLTGVEASLAREFAASLGLWVGRGGLGSGDLLVLKEGEGTGELRKLLRRAAPGEFVSLPRLRRDLFLYTCATSEELGLVNDQPPDLSSAAGGNLTAWNLGGDLSDFARGTRRVIQKLGPGDELVYPAAFFDRWKLVQEVAAGLRVACEMLRDICGTRLHVGNLEQFERETALDLAGLQEEDKKEYASTSVSHLKLHIVQLLSLQLGLWTQTTTDEVGGQVLSVSLEPNSPAQVDKDGERTVSLQMIKQWCEEVFTSFASGTQEGQAVFLRKVDLHNFVDEAHKAHARKKGAKVDAQRRASMVHRCLKAVDEVFDDTYELQKDIGSKVRHGLCLEFFQVFLTKVAEVQGWSLISLLFAILNKDQIH